MQTFLPYPDFRESAACLDRLRLGNQRNEALTLLESLWVGNGWSKHAASKMWSGYEDALSLYYNIVIDEWESRGYKNNMQRIEVPVCEMPWWLGNENFHAAHRSNLLRKNPEHYSQFGWKEPLDLPYVWPEGKQEN